MNSIWQAYYDMFHKEDNIDEIKKSQNNIIMEDDQDDMDDDQDQDQDDDDSDDSDDQTDDENDDSENEDEQSVSDKQEEQKKGAELKFSADLAAEFGNTCNKFTNLAANVVKQRTVDTQTADQLKMILEKLASLIQAAEKSI